VGLAWGFQSRAKVVVGCMVLPVVLEELAKWHLEECFACCKPEWLLVAAAESETFDDEV
jgi:hypothetical protein